MQVATNMSALYKQDFEYMARAIHLAEKGQYTTSPNPRVGCVIVKDQQIVGEGYHIRAGEGHAEVNALKQAGDNAQGATAYVTLEPCSHFGRTPPCAQALIKAGINKVVVGMTDPNPQVSGRGIEMLREAGIQVIEPCLEQDCKNLNPGFIKRMTENMPYVRLKLACSLDGRTAMDSGESQWITSADARRDVQTYRARSCAILSGSGTVLADNPSLNVRESDLNFAYAHQPVRQPIKCIIDNQLTITPDLKLFENNAQVYLLSNKARQQALPENCQAIQLNQQSAKVDLHEVMAELANKQINEIWVEAGAKLAGALIKENLVDELIIYQAPILMGENTFGLVNLPELTELKQAVRWQYVSQTRVGQDLKLVLKAI